MIPKTPGYPDVPAFIYGITREIWEDRGIGGKLAVETVRGNINALLPGGHPARPSGATPSTLQYLAGRRITLEFAEPEPLELDGDSAGAVSSVTFDVMPGTLRVVC